MGKGAGQGSKLTEHFHSEREEAKGLWRTSQLSDWPGQSETIKRNIVAKMSKKKKTDIKTEKILCDFVHDQLTTSRKEHQVTREEAGRGSNRLTIQEKDHVTNRVSRGEESLKVQTAECNGVPVGERAGDKRAAL